MTEEKKVFAEWYSLGAQEMSQGTIETRAMLVPGAGVLVQIDARTAGGRAALTSQWLPGVVIYEGRLVGEEEANRRIQAKFGARQSALPPLPPPPPLNLMKEGSASPVHPEEPPEVRTALESALTSVLTSAQKVSPEPKVETATSDPIKKLARKARTRKSDPPVQ
jgi:hypothetical protein